MQSIDLAGVGMTSQRTRERLIERLSEQGITNQSVLETIRITPRHIFLDEALSHRAYEDTALPIGFSQTLSQPYVVALMTQLLLANGTPRKVLEIGTGWGGFLNNSKNDFQQLDSITISKEQYSRS